MGRLWLLEGPGVQGQKNKDREKIGKEAAVLMLAPPRLNKTHLLGMSLQPLLSHAQHLRDDP